MPGRELRALKLQAVAKNKQTKQNKTKGLPWWENLPANLGRSHTLQGNWAHEPQLLSLRVWSLCSVTREAVIVRGPRTAMKSGPRLPQLEKALAQKRRPNTAKNK